MSRSNKIHSQEEYHSVISSNNVQIDNSISNTHNSNMSNNFESHIDSLNNQKRPSMVSKLEAFDKTRTTMRKQTDSSSNMGKKSNLMKRPSANSSELKKSKKRKLSNTDNKDNNNQQEMNIQKNDLEPIMEAPPLEKIVKKSNIYEFYINNIKGNTEELFFKDNKISTTKYNIFTFLPKALMFQFVRLANVYFVFIAVLQSIPIISPLGAATAIAH